jgi:hypothetical protein
VEKSLLTEEGSKYNANKRYYRFLNKKWEYREDESTDAAWKLATINSDITLILTNWDAKFRTTSPVTGPPITTPPVTNLPDTNKPQKDSKPPKVTTPSTEIPKVTPPDLLPSQKAAKLKEIEKDVKAGKCNATCIIDKVKEFKFGAPDQQRLMSLLP